MINGNSNSVIVWSNIFLVNVWNDFYLFVLKFFNLDLIVLVILNIKRVVVIFWLFILNVFKKYGEMYVNIMEYEFNYRNVMSKYVEICGFIRNLNCLCKGIGFLVIVFGIVNDVKVVKSNFIILSLMNIIF